MLYLIGVGLSDEQVPHGAVEACKKSDVYFEKYTGFLDQKRLENISKILDRPLKELDRSDLEENAKEIVRKAKAKDVAILIEGDPLTATTHKILFIEARKLKVKIKIIHAASIISAAMGESGLDFYRFGQICTISRWSEHYKPISFYETIEKNTKNNLHSIVLLDYYPETNTSMDIKEAFRILGEAENHYKKKIITKNTKIIILSNTSLRNEAKTVIEFGAAQKVADMQGPVMLIIPTKLSDIEREITEIMLK